LAVGLTAAVAGWLAGLLGNDRSGPMMKEVVDALRYVDQGRARGKVVVTP
jgi:hypothetical protein